MSEGALATPFGDSTYIELRATATEMESLSTTELLRIRVYEGPGTHQREYLTIQGASYVSVPCGANSADSSTRCREFLGMQPVLTAEDTSTMLPNIVIENGVQGRRYTVTLSASRGHITYRQVPGVEIVTQALTSQEPALGTRVLAAAGSARSLETFLALLHYQPFSNWFGYDNVTMSVEFDGRRPLWLSAGIPIAVSAVPDPVYLADAEQGGSALPA